MYRTKVLEHHTSACMRGHSNTHAWTLLYPEIFPASDLFLKNIKLSVLLELLEILCNLVLAEQDSVDIVS